MAVTGIGFPIGLSYTLQPLLGATTVQAFAAGAALCSTSLGTTFTVLASSGLSSTRLGVVLTSAAMMDDVVGLVMVQVISNLGGGDIGAVTIIRPILVSVAFAIIVPLICRFAVKPVTIMLNWYRETHPEAYISRLFCLRHTPFVIHTGLLLGMVAGASYAGTSNLFAAYIAGAVISWWDIEVPHPAKQLEERSQPSHQGINVQDEATNRPNTSPEGITSPKEREVPRKVEQPRHDSEVSANPKDDGSGAAVYERYYQQPVCRILQPLFFASIGFSIPITRMFQGSIVWRGIVYTVLMTFAKLVCGFWLVRFSLAPLKESMGKLAARIRLPPAPHLWGRKTSGTVQARQAQEPSTSAADSSPQTASASKPFSLHPPMILACAMTARGEIGFLISSVAESNGVFSSAGTAGMESDLFLIVTWAIVLCTIIGPLGVGLSVRRVKKLEEKKNVENEGSGKDVLGVWGVG